MTNLSRREPLQQRLKNVGRVHQAEVVLVFYGSLDCCTLNVSESQPLYLGRE